MRDDNYLQMRLDYLWDRYFSDVEQKNDVRIVFGRKARTRLGSIKQLTVNRKQLTGRFLVKPGMTGKKPVSGLSSQPVNSTIITINGLFENTDIPEFLIDSVIAHEMVHYTHGFGSPHEKKYATPHAGGVIKKEMLERGLSDLFHLQDKWLKSNWQNYVKENLPYKSRVRRRRKRRVMLFR